MEEILKKFGRYFLLDRIAQGGMAEIYRARLATVDGPGRLLVIKRISSTYGAQNEFLQMFRSEIKVTMGFNHKNIVQLYDFGEEKSQPYIVMEFVDGKNLRQLMSRFAQNQEFLPVEYAAYIAEQAACGLHYAHSFRDKITGAPLNIVHRDISPQNILVSFEGNVKIIDFGIAKATVNPEATRAGIIKGKPSYLSPEQVTGSAIDYRSDIFALGIVLWEMLAGRKLFQGDNDLTVLKLIESCQTSVKPPSTVNSQVPPELDEICMKALSKQPSRRFQTAEEFQKTLHRFLQAYAPDFDLGELSFSAKDVFKVEIVEDRKRIQRLNEKAEQLLQSASLVIHHPLSVVESEEEKPIPRIPAPPREETTVVETRPKPSEPLDLGYAGLREGSIEIEVSQLTRQRRRQQEASKRGKNEFSYTEKSLAKIYRPDQGPRHGLKWVMLGFCGTAAAAMIYASTQSNSRKWSFEKGDFPFSTLVSRLQRYLPGHAASIVLEGAPQEAIVDVDGEVFSRSLPATLNRVPAGKPIVVSVAGKEGSFKKELQLQAGERRSIPVTLTRPEPNETAGSRSAPLRTDLPKSVLLKLNLQSTEQLTLQINGLTVNPSKPIQVPLDKSIELVAQRPGYKTLKRVFTIESPLVAGGLKEWKMDLQLEPIQFGFLTIDTVPSADAKAVIDGKTWLKRTPFENEKLPVGTYTIHLVNELLGMEKSVSVTIQEGKVVTKSEKLDIHN